MKPLILILTLFVQIGFAQTRQDEAVNDLNGFNDFLGKEKATALNATVNSFDKFLLANYPKLENENAKTRKFLEDCKSYQDSLPQWKLDHKEITTILELLEISGMRREFCRYNYEEPDYSYSLDSLFPWPESESDTLQSLILEDLEEDTFSIWSLDLDSLEIERRIIESEHRSDSLSNVNLGGKFFYGLAKFAPNDSNVQAFVEATNIFGGIPSTIMIDVTLERKINFEEPFYKRIIVAEIYYYILRFETKKKQRHANNR